MEGQGAAPAACVAGLGLTPKQAAARLGISLKTLWRWTSRGIVPQPNRITRSTVRWPERVIEEFLAQQEEKARQGRERNGQAKARKGKQAVPA